MKKSSVVLFTLLLLVVNVFAQRGRVRRDPMTDKEADAMREYRDQPDKRIHLMVTILQKRGADLEKIEKDPKAVPPSERGAKTHDLLEDITNLVDEFDDNVDTFLKEGADIRKPLSDAVTAETALQSQLTALKTGDADKPWFQEFSFQLADASEAVDQSLKSTRDAITEDAAIVKEAKEKAKQKR